MSPELTAIAVKIKLGGGEPARPAASYGPEASTWTFCINCGAPTQCRWACDISCYMLVCSTRGIPPRRFVPTGVLLTECEALRRP